MLSSLRVLTYHRILGGSEATRCNPSVVSATPEDFERQMRHVARRYAVVSASQVRDAFMAGCSLPSRAVLITFDDACRDFKDTAWPILKTLDVPVTVFVPTAYPDSHLAFWWDRLYRAISTTCRQHIAHHPLGLLSLADAEAKRRTLKTLQTYLKRVPHADALRAVDDLCRLLTCPEQPHVEAVTSPLPADVLGWRELRELAADGVTIGAHTRTHPALTQLAVDAARDEIAGSRDDVAHQIGRVPFAFAYPFGDHNETVAALVHEAGFAWAVTCLDGHNRRAADPFRLQRINITPRTSALVLGVRLTAAGETIDRWRHREIAVDQADTVPTAHGSDSQQTPALSVAYVMSRFPKISETFILNEMSAVAALGARVELYPLLRERQAIEHPEVAQWMPRAHFHPLLSWRIARAHAHFLARSPAGYLSTLWRTFAGNCGSRRLLVGAAGTFPRAVRFAYEMERSGVDHVHAHFATHPALAGYVIHRLTRIPFSFTAHGSDLHVDRRMLREKVAASAFAVTVSRFNKSVMTHECGAAAAGKIHVVHCGVDPHYFAPPATRPRQERLRIVCIASFEPVKGHVYLVDACRRLRDRGIEFDCDLVGDGRVRREIEQRVLTAGLAAQVRFLGLQPRPAVAQLLSLSHVAVLPSHPTREGKREGIPVALMEAMAAGLAVVSTAISGIPELVEHERTGLLVPSGDAAALADALERLAADRELSIRLGNAARRKVISDFDLQANAARLLALFGRTPAPAGADADAAAASRAN
jgi:glycosyltransferase involved in cell wall biosynthesis/peptidoglycan/xylan/chitin deacetylase (PgdA/CDA1 family)